MNPTDVKAENLFYAHCLHCQTVPYEGFDIELESGTNRARALCRTCGRPVIQFVFPRDFEMVCALCQTGEEHSH